MAEFIEVLEDVVPIVDGIKICESCAVGQYTKLGGPVAVGLEHIDKENIVFLFKCDICGDLKKFKDENYRQDLLNRYPTHESRTEW